jgi:hypothetical protein
VRDERHETKKTIINQKSNIRLKNRSSKMYGPRTRNLEVKKKVLQGQEKDFPSQNRTIHILGELHGQIDP